MRTFLLAVFTLLNVVAIQAQSLNLETDNGVKYNDPQVPASIGIVLYSNDVETVFNALRFANYSQEWDNQVQIFLLGKGVELEGLVNTNEDIKKQVDTFVGQGGVIMGCQTCFQSRKKDGSQICKVACIQDLYDLVKKNQIVLTF